MPKFTVKIEHRATKHKSFVVDAKNRDDAFDKAYYMICCHDFDKDFDEALDSEFEVLSMKKTTSKKKGS